MATMESLIGLVNRIQRACTVLGDHGGEGMGCQTPMSSECLRAYWTPAMERYFIDLMLDHMHRDNRVGHTFNKQAWADMLSMFSAKFGTQHDKDILKNRYSTLWKQFNDVKNLLDQSGFSWDDTQQMVVAEDYVWDLLRELMDEKDWNFLEDIKQEIV
ncbi:Dynamin-related protein 1C [Camellia lanceoleosa]|uniref:Dynamin-related protein 1C n=1 Tax=Camellia lanceoleosa TaxID=1840588 RepID=A0ACC0HGQ4_9ERIC|nr:Dynamin-related protein 1C [Camellia lanceoleosa]